jgi:SAM-dependent methyltransferase
MKRLNQMLSAGVRSLLPAPWLRPITAAHALCSTGLIPPPHLHNVGLADFATVGDIFLKLFVSLCGLREDDRVLDIGAGTGRMARPLTTVLKTGTYHGLEIVKESVYWCRLAYRNYPNFDFQHADIRNSVYNPTGAFSAAEYRFPFADQSFTFVILTSVFTHMLRAEVETYLSELARVLTRDGRVFATFFLLDDASRDGIRRGASAMNFSYRTDRSWYQSEKRLEAAVAYDELDVVSMCRRAGLHVSSLYHGTWSGRPQGFSWQDIVILHREDCDCDYSVASDSMKKATAGLTLRESL